jgi:phosphotransferase system HPr (HPr) family protein
MVERTLCTSLALHARPLDRFVRLARSHACAVRLRHGGKQADGRNVTQLLLLGIPTGVEVTLVCEGPDEREALEALAALLATADSGTAGAPAPAPPTGARATTEDMVLEGTAGAPGVGIGRLRRVARQRAATPRAPGCPADESARVAQALGAARAATDALCGGEDDPFCDIFRAQRTLLEDPALAEALAARVAAGGVSAEEAVHAEFGEIEARFAALGTVFAAERHADVADIGDRILEALGAGTGGDHGGRPDEERLVLALREATPSRMALVDLARVAAVISERGGPTSHAAIVARGRGIPLVFAGGRELAELADGVRLLVDGGTGTVSRVGDDVVEQVAADHALPTPRPPGPASTADGCRVYLRANLGAPGDLSLARRHGCDGCGLLRSELLFAGRIEPPSVEEQARAYARVATALAPHSTTVRLFDAGSDKPLAFLPTPGDEPNPALGLRGLRLLLRHPEVLRAQLEAVALARRISGMNVRALAPMVIDASELERVRELAPPELPIGAMVETPAAALLVRPLAQASAFLSVGTNDLGQYLLALDRGRPSASPLHPALLRLLAEIARAAVAAGRELSVCGELAGDARCAPLLLGLGIHMLSVTPARVPQLREGIARRSLAELEELAAEALAIDDPRALARRLELKEGGP